MAIANKDGNTLLHFAAAWGNGYLIELLCSNNDHINTKNNLGQTPLHIAYKHNNIETAMYLINRGASVNIQDNNGKTPFQLDESVAI